MNLQEFKAWFEGFTENMKGPPSDKAWKRIQARVAEITEKPTEIRYFYDHYWRPYYHYYSPHYASGTILCSSGSNAINNRDSTSYSMQLSAAAGSPQFANSSQAFAALGHADAQALEAA